MEKETPDSYSQNQACDFCGSREGERRAIGEYVVELRVLEYKGSTRKACQGCAHKYEVLNRSREREGKLSFYHLRYRFDHLKKIAAIIRTLGKR